MPVRPCMDLTAFNWLRHSTVELDHLITWGPEEFDAYARVRFIPDPTPETPHAADVCLPGGHLSDLEQTQRVLRVLRPFTATPHDCYFCVWDGYSDLDVSQFPSSSRVSLPTRDYVLLHGSLADINDWADVFNAAWPPAFVWPADHRWCFTSDVDPHWAAVGGAVSAVQSLIEDALLDAVRADPSQPVPTFR